ncbi:MAG: fumarylacetoacetate hydrolase family protein [Vulcanococcus sp.]|jgi:2-keto-4-pentenoate hydratase/2-oxohepta-3-ene-1,7-dioic acid hydratase in catechol pathway|uniref:fumarylacetoacetate hydrolase family protein n=1 Tax=Vulcanococcus sp. TaxID=2856995 RepID=UPI0025E74B3E|nr:fumarylacetoacetate hydrolase family protein [Vulcanococcus sp.]MBW0175304.1 fumarylacetoacetate hydrolase family protein [Vulcanococcus sp.]MBW0180599.1 fumarylacetoacetate hydrolase family protein [Vulcanococcus sp.]
MTASRPPAILCIGKNYADHAAEVADPGTFKLPERPVLFFKNPACVIGNGAAIELPPVVHTNDRDPPMGVDYEGELAVILGCDARDVPEAQAREVIAAVACANDVSQRWWQWHGSGGQWCRGKSFDTFCPLGEPTPISAIADLQDLLLTTRLNGEVVQQASTSTMIFSVARLISELSQGTTLLAGSVILTGTPAGVGAGRKPPRFLRDGDVVEVEISGVGCLSNPVRNRG